MRTRIRVCAGKRDRALRYRCRLEAEQRVRRGRASRDGREGSPVLRSARGNCRVEDAWVRVCHACGCELLLNCSYAVRRTRRGRKITMRLAHCGLAFRANEEARPVDRCPRCRERLGLSRLLPDQVSRAS